MLESEAPNRRREVIPGLLFLGIEPHTLADDLLRLAGRAPDMEGAFETHGEDAFGFEFPRAGAEGVRFAGGGVGGSCAFEVGWDITAHVEALHSGGGWFGN